MAATFAPRASMIASALHTNEIPGNWFEDDIEMTADGSYPANGYAFGNAQLQTMYGGAYSTVRSVELVNPVMVSSSGAPQPFLAAWDKVHSTIRIFSTATDAELATANPSANGFVATFRVRFA